MQGSSGNKEQFHWTRSSWGKNSQLGKYWPTGQLPPRQSKYDSHSLCDLNSICQHKQWQKWAVKSNDDQQIRVVKTNKQWQKLRNENAIEKQTSHQLPRHREGITDLNKNKNNNHAMIIRSTTTTFLSLITLIVASIKFQISKQRENFQSRVKIFFFGMFRKYFFSPFTSSFFWSAASFPHQPYLGLWWLETAILFSAISTTNETLPKISSISFFREHCIDHRPCQQGDWLEGLKSIFSSNIPSLLFFSSWEVGMELS